ncbi:uncharacterized protein METZ01_LOCUS242477, partial [marine metagenome]
MASPNLQKITLLCVVVKDLQVRVAI